MELGFYLIKSMFVILGIIIILIGRYVSGKFLMPNNEKYKVSNENNYLKSCRILLFSLGFYYLSFGIVMMFVKGWPLLTGIGIWVVFIPMLIVFPFYLVLRKHVIPENKIKN